MRSRRSAAWGYLLALLGALLVVFFAGRHWALATYRGGSSFPSARIAVTGNALDPLPEAFAFVVLAGTGARLAVRGGFRLLVGVLVVAAAAASLAACLDSALELAPQARAAAASAPGALAGVPLITGSAWPWLAVVVAAAALAGSLLLIRAGGAGLSGRYSAAGARPASPPDGDEDVAAWDALDRGEDPTREAGSPFASATEAVGSAAAGPLDPPAVDAAADDAVPGSRA